ncbi:MAG: hypothetical protein ACHQ9S_25670 [Candidatus Binatia bacterium]
MKDRAKDEKLLDRIAAIRDELDDVCDDLAPEDEDDGADEADEVEDQEKGDEEE